MTTDVQFPVKFGEKLHFLKEKLSNDITPKYLITKFLNIFEENDNPESYSLIVYIKDESPYYLKEESINSLSKINMMILCKEKKLELKHFHTHLMGNESAQIKNSLELLESRLQIEEFLQACLENRTHEKIFELIEKHCLNDHLQLSVSLMNVFAALVLHTRKKEDFDDSGDEPYLSWLELKPEIIRNTLKFTKKTEDFTGICSSLKILVSYLSNEGSLKDTILLDLDSNFLFGTLEKLFKCTKIPKQTKCSIQISVIQIINFNLQQSINNKDEYVKKFKKYFSNDGVKKLKDNIELLSKHLREFPSGLPPLGSNEASKAENELLIELTKLQYYIMRPLYWDLTDISYDGPKIQDLELLKQILPECEKIGESETFKKLGFENPISPSKDFSQETGQLVFKCIYYAVTNNYDEMINIFSKNRGFENFNFIKTSFSLVKILEKTFQIIDVFDENFVNGVYLPLLYNSCDVTNDDLSRKFFYELFYKCFLVYSQLIIDSSYKNENFDQIENQFTVQISEVINCYPLSIAEFSSWLGKIKSENAIKKKREAQVREWEDNNTTPNPFINELKKELTLEYEEIVSKKKIKQLQERAYSFEMGIKSLQKYSLQLDASRSVIMVKEESDKDVKAMTWQISQIKKVLSDKNCPNYNSRKNNKFYLSLTMEPNEEGKEESKNLICDNKKNFYLWVDGLNILINKKPISKDFSDEVSHLLALEMKIRFLLIKKEMIPTEPLGLPKPPDNYDFSQ